ncbi:MAG TPA: hypothetical protein G4O07_02460, partial [Dehalococcoidia bacterium]|nr:hypothetical protein [Dehalococcoidia bacterium]
MKRRLLSMILVIGLITGLMVVPAQAATEDEIEGAITEGLEWLVPQQNLDGSWGQLDDAGNPLPLENYAAKTGLVLVKLQERAYELGFESPFDPNYEYSQDIIEGWEYIFLNCTFTQPIGMQD